MSNRKDWKRLSGKLRTRNIRKGLQARIADPLWMLTRQWQFGEFKGDDAASPAKIQVKYNSIPVESLQAYRADGKLGPKRNIDKNELLEASVEKDFVTDGPAAIRISAESAVQFLRRIPQSERRIVHQMLRRDFPLKTESKINAGRHRFLAMLIQRAFDGRSFFKSGEDYLKNIASETSMSISAVGRIFRQWKQYYSNRFHESVAGGTTWQKERLEYKFSVSTPKDKPIVARMAAEEYLGGRLDWFQFDLADNGSKGLSKAFDRSENLWLIPSPIRYAGMPADRFWDFEDGKVFFGGLSAGATDLAQLILTEFATVYSNDWYMIPIPVQTGSLTRVAKIEVRDSFGEKHEIKPAAVNDGADRNWRFFELSGDPSAEHGFSPWLYVPRTVLGGHEDRPVEKVVFTRDDMANMAWGIEETVEGQSGHRVSRRTEWLKRRAEMDAYISRYVKPNQGKAADNEQGSNKTPQDQPWKYRLINVIPPYWVPFSPEVIKNQVTNRLIRGRMAEWDLLEEAKQELAGAQGKLLQPEAPMFIQEEEIPRGAIEVSRSYQAARDTEGKLVVWAGRRKRPASGSRSSGRETDQLEISDRNDDE